jgi:hypothetical protein
VPLPSRGEFKALQCYDRRLAAIRRKFADSAACQSLEA